MYYLLCLAAALVVIAIISAAISRHERASLRRRLKAAEMLDSLAHYSTWFALQRPQDMVPCDAGEAASPLRQAQAIGQECFPGLEAEVTQLMAVHSRLLDFVQAQYKLRIEDAEAWLESDHEERFAQLWLEHRRAMQDLVYPLRIALAAGISPANGRESRRQAA